MMRQNSTHHSDDNISHVNHDQTQITSVALRTVENIADISTLVDNLYLLQDFRDISKADSEINQKRFSTLSHGIEKFCLTPIRKSKIIYQSISEIHDIFVLQQLLNNSDDTIISPACRYSEMFKYSSYYIFLYLSIVMGDLLEIRLKDDLKKEQNININKNCTKFFEAVNKFIEDYDFSQSKNDDKVFLRDFNKYYDYVFQEVQKKYTGNEFSHLVNEPCLRHYIDKIRPIFKLKLFKDKVFNKIFDDLAYINHIYDFVNIPVSDQLSNAREEFAREKNFSKGNSSYSSRVNSFQHFNNEGNVATQLQLLMEFLLEAESLPPFGSTSSCPMCSNKIISSQQITSDRMSMQAFVSGDTRLWSMSTSKEDRGVNIAMIEIYGRLRELGICMDKHVKYMERAMLCDYNLYTYYSLILSCSKCRENDYIKSFCNKFVIDNCHQRMMNIAMYFTHFIILDFAMSVYNKDDNYIVSIKRLGDCISSSFLSPNNNGKKLHAYTYLKDYGLGSFSYAFLKEIILTNEKTHITAHADNVARISLANE